MLVKIALAIIGIPLLIVGAMQGYLWYTTKENADRLISQLYQVAVVEYGGVHASLLGSVGLNNVRIRPANSQDVLNIDALRLNSSDVLSLYDLSTSLQQQRLPEAWSVSIDGLQASLYSDWLLAGAPPPAAEGSAPAVCRGDLRFAPETLEAIGYDTFRADIDIGYQFSSERGLMELHMDYNATDMFDMGLELQLAVTPGLTLSELQTTPPQLAGAMLSIENPMFYQRIRQYCAEQFDGDARRYIDNQVTTINTQLQAAGLALTPELINAYRRFLDQPEQASLVLAPSQPVAAAQLIFYASTDLPELLGLQVKVNRVAVDNPDIIAATTTAVTNEKAASATSDTELTPEGSTVATLQELIELTGTDDTDDTSPADERSEPPSAPVQQSAAPSRARFYAMPPSKLASHIGATVQIDIKNGQDYQGKLIEVGANHLIIDAKIYSGNARFTVGFDRIKQASVLLKQP